VIHERGDIVLKGGVKARRASQKRYCTLLPAINSLLFSDL
jgi:hypothetical protein